MEMKTMEACKPARRLSRRWSSWTRPPRTPARAAGGVRFTDADRRIADFPRAHDVLGQASPCGTQPARRAADALVDHPNHHLEIHDLPKVT